MRVGVYVDGYNLYYGGRSRFGRGTAGWRWLDIRALTSTLVGERTNWVDAIVHRVVYCTARVDQQESPSSFADQNVYLKALTASGSVDDIEFGRYSTGVKHAPLAVKGPNGQPQLATPAWPIMVQDQAGVPIRDARFMASFMHREEKGSDVNVATHLLWDVLLGQVDAAVVISNDSDLTLPLAKARGRVPVGLINPTSRQIAGALRGELGAGAGRHFWRDLTTRDFTRHQLSDPVGVHSKPSDW
jgi:hypothetical protein